MKLYKFLAPTLMFGSVVGFTSCNSEEDDIFNASAAERLDEYKKVYSNDLTAQGGRWLMEYFANEEERGYVFVMTFNPDGSVRVSGQNVWMDNSYRSDVSMWQIISDNGPVLSFNTYNDVLHVFSSPENLTGPEAPTNPDNGNKDIDETGEGHGGDYEFVILGLSEDGATMHLSGKKRLHDIYMHRLDASVDEVELLSSYYAAGKSTFSSVFPDMLLTDTKTGEQFVVNGGHNGLFNIWPKDGDAVIQTVTMNALIGPESIRFRKPFAIECANGVDSIVVENFVRQADGSFLCTDNDHNIIFDNCGYGNIFSNTSYVWNVTANSVGGTFADAFNAVRDQTTKEFKRTFKGLSWTYLSSDKRTAVRFDESGSYAKPYIYGEAEVIENGSSIKFNISTSDGNSNGRNRLNRLPALVSFIELLNSTSFRIESNYRFAPSNMRFVDVNNPANYITFTKGS